MINFADGQVNIGTENILFASDEQLNVLADEGVIERRSDSGGHYYYFEDEADGLRFGVIISLRDKKTEWLLLRSLDTPMKEWNDVSEKALKDEYCLLVHFVTKMAGRIFDNNGNRKRTWRFKWGKIEVSYEPRSFEAAIFMKPLVKSRDRGL